MCSLDRTRLRRCHRITRSYPILRWIQFMVVKRLMTLVTMAFQYNPSRSKIHESLVGFVCVPMSACMCVCVCPFCVDNNLDISIHWLLDHSSSHGAACTRTQPHISARRKSGQRRKRENAIDKTVNQAIICHLYASSIYIV